MEEIVSGFKSIFEKYQLKGVIYAKSGELPSVFSTGDTFKTQYQKFEVIVAYYPTVSHEYTRDLPGYGVWHDYSFQTVPSRIFDNSILHGPMVMFTLKEDHITDHIQQKMMDSVLWFNVSDLNFLKEFYITD